MRLAVAASPEVAIPSLVALHASEHEIIRIISQPDRPAGRGKSLTPTPVAQWATSHGYELIRPEKSSDLLPHLADIDCVITIGYGVLLPESMLSIPKHGFINLHFSLLPRWRGAAPVQRAIEAGDLLSGVTVFKLDAGMDTGPIYTMHRFALDEDITSDELLIELGELGVSALLEALVKIESGERPVAQRGEGATKAAKLTREEGKIDWNQSAERISAKIRAFTSSPGAWTIFRGEQLKISAPRISTQTLNPGQISLIEKKVYIGTSTTALEIRSITAPGKAAMPAQSWANGARLKEDESCE